MFLALLLNAFTADNLEESQSNEESKMVQSIKGLFTICKRKQVCHYPLDGSTGSLTFAKTERHAIYSYGRFQEPVKLKQRFVVLIL